MSETTQAQEHQNLAGDEAKNKVAELVEGLHICMMSTMAADGSIDSRPMAVQREPFEGCLYFLTRRSSEKIDELEEDRHVTLSFADTSNQKYLTLKGRGVVTTDHAKIHQLWNTMYKAWFPKGPEDPEIAVLRVDVREGDFWQASGSKILFFARYVLAAATGGHVPVGTSGHLQV